MTNSEALEFSVFKRLSFCAPVSLEELLHILPGHSWNQLFAAIDGLSRRGAITLGRTERGTYHISLGPYSRPEGHILSGRCLIHRQLFVATVLSDRIGNRSLSHGCTMIVPRSIIHVVIDSL